VNVQVKFGFIKVEDKYGGGWQVSMELVSPTSRNYNFGHFKTLGAAVAAVEKWADDRQLDIRPVMSLDIGRVEDRLNA